MSDADAAVRHQQVAGPTPVAGSTSARHFSRFTEAAVDPFASGSHLGHTKAPPASFTRGTRRAAPSFVHSGRN